MDLEICCDWSRPPNEHLPLPPWRHLLYEEERLLPWHPWFVVEEFEDTFWVEKAWWDTPVESNYLKRCNHCSWTKSLARSSSRDSLATKVSNATTSVSYSLDNPRLTWSIRSWEETGELIIVRESTTVLASLRYWLMDKSLIFTLYLVGA